MELLQLGVITGLIAIVAQTGAMFYWGGKMHANMSQLSKATTDHENRLRFIENNDRGDRGLRGERGARGLKGEQGDKGEDGNI